MTNTHIISNTRTVFAVEINGAWVLAEWCTCRTIHRFRIVGDEPDRNIPRRQDSQLTKEWLNYFTEKVEAYKRGL